MKIGAAFPEYIRTERINRKNAGGDFVNKAYPVRSYLLFFFLITFTTLIFVRLFFLQIFQGSYYRNLSDSNRTRTITIHAPRGIIFDRNQIPLVFNIPGYRELPDGTSSTGRDNKVKLIDNDLALKLISMGKNNLEIDSLRSYPYKDAASHILGYIGQISEEELGQKELSGYKGGELIGKIGIEREYEQMLKGENGKELAEVDSRGRVVRKLGKTDPIPGENISLTLDLDLQKAVYSAMEGVKRGAAIVSKPNGEILALVSKPSFDPNLFTLSENYVATESSYKNIDQILLDEQFQPLINRAIQGIYPPGSTFKIVVAAAGLENKIIDENFTVEDTGILHVGDFSFSNWYFTQYGKTDGAVNVVKALKRSNDIFFYKLGELVGVDKLSKFAEKFGLGQKLGIDLLGEEEGVLPTSSWKKKEIGEQWYLGDTYHYGIGQGYLLTTPLQVNFWTAAIANDGVLPIPHLLKNQKSILRQAQDKNQKFLSEKTLSLIRQGMVESCSPGGVAWPLFELKVKGKLLTVACKTGTAQHGGEETLPHAWITLYAPAPLSGAMAYDPQIVVTVLSESSGEGSNIAAPIAKKILEEWFGR